MTSILSNIQLKHLYSFTLDPNVIPPSAVTQVKNLLQTRYNLRDTRFRAILPEGYDPYDYKKNRFPEFPSDWVWEWTVTDKSSAYRGNFTKRYGSFVWKTAGLKIPPDILQEIGNVVRAAVSDATNFIWEFDPEINWKAGDFGDRDSCFWQSRREAKDIIMQNGGLAVKFYRLKNVDGGVVRENVEGIGRCWAAPDFPKEGMMTVFNGYGFQGNAIATITETLCGQFGMVNTKVSLRNQGSDGGTLYINSGVGYVIAPQTELEKIVGKTWDLEWSINESTGCTCRSCGEHIPEGDEYTAEGYDGVYCSSCFEDLFSICTVCDQYHHNNDLHQLSNEDDVCSQCLRDSCSTCSYCGEHSLNADMHHVGDDSRTLFCESCFEDHATMCDDCGSFYPTSLIVSTADGLMCAECSKKVSEESSNE